MSQDLIRFLTALDRETCSSCTYLTYDDDESDIASAIIEDDINNYAIDNTNTPSLT